MPVVSYWAGPGFPGEPKLSDTSLRQLKDGGWNTVWATTPEELLGIGCIPAIRTMPHGSTSCRHGIRRHDARHAL